MANVGVTVKPYTKKELRQMYGISQGTFREWMNRAGVCMDHARKILTTKEVETIFRHHGPPESLLTGEI